MSLPTLDMSLFFGTPEEQQEFGSALLQHLKRRGVAKINNHGIPDEQISRLFDMVRFVILYSQHRVTKFDRLVASSHYHTKRKCMLSIRLSRTPIEVIAMLVRRVSLA